MVGRPYLHEFTGGYSPVAQWKYNILGVKTETRAEKSPGSISLQLGFWLGVIGRCQPMATGIPSGILDWNCSLFGFLVTVLAEARSDNSNVCAETKFACRLQVSDIASRVQIARDKARMSGLDHYMTEWDVPYSYDGVVLVVVLVLLVPLVLLVLGTYCFLITRGGPHK